ncbi:MAG TPA: hypothetical protein PK573_03260 [Spirochaetota bacterium]|mgnify:FL=1|nr:hypothetical protein [Spirochaetota bacterium]HRZ28534.1 hypothetical protein [Spirochaetota bacterium]HSA13209.1 hypothetical protein [Spirochaetota bacterium]
MKKGRGRKNNQDFRELLKKYLEIKGLDIVILLADGKEIELNKNRILIDNEIITFDKGNREHRIPLSSVKSVELYAA